MTWHIYVGLALVAIALIAGAVGALSGPSGFMVGSWINVICSAAGFGLIAYRIFVIWVVGEKDKK